jgi:hypothetical protein
LIDITAKSGVGAFAPDYGNVKLYKEGRMGEEQYTDLYQEKMADSRLRYPKVWDRLAAYPRSAYACYCPKGVFCHRHLFILHAQTHLESLGWRVVLMGELTKDTMP